MSGGKSVVGRRRRRVDVGDARGVVRVLVFRDSRGGLLGLLLRPDHDHTRWVDGQGQLGGAAGLIWREGQSLVEDEDVLAAVGGLDDGGIEREVWGSEG
jgi:hypothetical protein